MVLLFVGLIVIACSIAALVYTFQPVQLLTDQAPLAPTLFTAP
jgi:hypothetical protein